MLADGPWPHGELATLSASRIGEAFGLSAEVYRLRGATTVGDTVDLVAKVEHLAGCRRAQTAHRHVVPSLGRSVPRLWAADVPPLHDETADEAAAGLLLLEDITPAEQGDEFVMPSVERGLDLIRLVARVHDVPQPSSAETIETWVPFVSPPERWAASVDRGRARYPEIFETALSRLLTLRDDALAAVDELSGADATWIHVDPHLDNVLWRPNGSTVLLDWSNCRRGPPAVDLAVLLFTLSFADTEVLAPSDLVEAYAAARTSMEIDPAATMSLACSALVLHARSVFGWAGQLSNDGFHDRKAELRNDAARRVARVLDWLDGRTGFSGRSRT